ncbi:hypothetical protein [Legionella impletisoli]|uniref:EF-hand domain-containing protein n=1 Tax=Legionella impletisoli TaxID=343510 RepID=A0A917JQE3_9GAMM|nr:hypothetical protein [Legionella impletisoli]GGI77487.1 hypothetical protein GCM10007966_02770 [Legionella impletisoli]
MGNCCRKFFDRNKDGQVDADEVLKTIAEALHLLSKAALAAEAYVKALEAAGVDTKGTLDVLQRIKTIADASGDVTDALSKIKVPKKLEDIGDFDGDGDFDKEDMLAYLNHSLSVCDALIAANVKTEEVENCRKDIQRVIDAVKEFEAPTVNAGAAAAAL